VAKFVKAYAALGPEIERAVRRFDEDVRSGVFPDPAHEYAKPG
jgi:ketopantoate hydroxymethyltransferase